MNLAEIVLGIFGVCLWIGAILTRRVGFVPLSILFEWCGLIYCATLLVVLLVTSP